MSNLDKLLKRLAGSDEGLQEATETPQPEQVDPVYVEKLASAVEFLISSGTLTKEADLGKVKALMAQGMGAEEAVRKAYPDWSDEQVAAMVEKLGSEKPGKAEAPKEESPEAEKAASVAGDRLRALLASRRDQTKTASVAEETTFDFSSKVRSALKEKIAVQAGSKAQGDFEFINSVLKKLQTLAAATTETVETQKESPTTETTEETVTASKEASAVDEVEVEAEEATEATKEAEASTNLKLNLADMLKEATSEKAASESTPEGGAETAMEQQSNSLTDMLRNSILRKARTQVEV